LGRLKLKWCPSCNLPILDEPKCGTCGHVTDHVNITPPGDIRPARSVDLVRIRKVADDQFGPASGRALLPDDDDVVILNKAPAEDRMDEVISDGRVIATMRYVPITGWKLLPRLEGAARMAKVATRGIVVLADDAVPFIEKGASVLAPGVTAASESIKAGDDVLVLTEDGQPGAVGIARMLGNKMVEESHGVCVKVRHHRKEGIMVPGPSPQRRWADVIDANRGHMETMIERGKAFVRRISEEEDMPTAVSFSGGKDSLATLLLVLEAGFKPPVVFVDTGIELPETIVHVREVAERHDLELIVEESDQDFVARSCQFGPPSRDYRWCCKTQKLGPVARALNRRFPGGMITFIGQRRYESGPRSRSGAVWRNPWVPGQVGASPIQDWTALHIWLYIMMRDEPVNPWYDLGLERIGCYPCPATDLADLEVVERHFPGYGRWRGFLEEWASAIGHDVRWVDLGLWRFRNVPKSLREISPGAAEPAPGHEPRPAITFQSLPPKELQDAGVTWYEARGVFDRKLDMERAAELLTVLGRTSLDSDVGMVTVGDGVLEVGREGTVVARGHDEAKATKMLERARQLLVKAELCVGCGVCVPRCPEDALCTEDLQIRLERSDCIHCGSCFGPCAVVDFPPVLAFGDGR
jgi:phosphoadenosine phosphosulfate reductase